MKEVNNRKKFSVLYFYPDAWLKDLALMSCTFEAQGAWIRLMCHMHESEKYGYLFANNEPLKEDGIRNLLGLRHSPEIFDSIWAELTINGVAKQDSTGAFYSKRMVNDYKTYSDKVAKDNALQETYSKEITSVIAYLNKKTGKNFDANDSGSVKLIIEKLTAGYKESDLKKVIDVKCEEWIDDDHYSQFLTPSTLFGKKFNNYINQKLKHAPQIKYENPYNQMMKK